MPRHKCPSCGHEFDPEFDGTVTDDSPEGLAQLWCFMLTRRKFGAPRDLPADITPEIANMIQLGISAYRLRTEILRRGRDRGEYMWQFKQRFGLGLPIKGFAGTRVFDQSAQDEHNFRQRKQFERDAKTALPPEEVRKRLKEMRERIAGIGDMPDE